MTNQEIIALAATVWDEAQELHVLHLRQAIDQSKPVNEGLKTHVQRCQNLYLAICARAGDESPFPFHHATKVHDPVHTAALKVVEAMDVDAREIKVPGVLALALLNLRNAVKRGQGTFEERVADVLARKCDELEAENEELKRKCGA